MRKNLLLHFAFLFFFILTYFAYMSICLNVCLWCLWKSDKGMDPLELGRDGCKLPYGCWELSQFSFTAQRHILPDSMCFLYSWQLSPHSLHCGFSIVFNCAYFVSLFFVVIWECFLLVWDIYLVTQDGQKTHINTTDSAFSGVPREIRGMRELPGLREGLHLNIKLPNTWNEITVPLASKTEEKATM